MNSPLFSLGKSDFFKGAVTAVFAALITTLYGLVTQAGFDVFSADWASILNEVVKVSIASFMAYLMKNFTTSEDGTFLGLK